MPENAVLKRMKIVEDRAALLSHEFSRDVNCIIQPRSLRGDFNSLAQAVLRNMELLQSGHQLLLFQNMAKVEPEPIAIAAQAVYDDLTGFLSAGFEKVNALLFWRYPEKANENYVFHADIAPGPKGRVLCNYNEPLTRFIDNDDVVAVSDDGLYKAKRGARIVMRQPGDLIRMARLDKNVGYPPAIHQAPQDKGISIPRLILKVD